MLTKLLRMSIVLPGTDLSLAPTIAPVVAKTGTVREALMQLSRKTFRFVQLDATLSGIRPRELSTRARRDLAGLVSRSNMALGGLDFFIPRQHFVQSQHMDRAVASALAAITLAADLGRVPLSIALPVEQMSDDTKSALVEAADAGGVRLAVHAEDQHDALLAWAQDVDLPALGMGIDPAAMLLTSRDPVAYVHSIAKHLVVARLSDASHGDATGARQTPGDGDLDLMSYRIALSLAQSRTGPVVLDLRQLSKPLSSAELALENWNAAAADI